MEIRYSVDISLPLQRTDLFISTYTQLKILKYFIIYWFYKEIMFYL